MSQIGAVHLTVSLLAVLFGALVLWIPKGTRWHRTWGHGYVWSMVGVVVTSFSLFNLTGRLGPFHLAALVSAIVLAAGMWTVLKRRPRKSWIEAHANWMAWSYVGLLAAFVSESLTRFAMPLAAETLEQRSLWPAFWGLVFVGTGLTVGIGTRMIKKRVPAAVASTPEAMRREQAELTANG